MKPTLQLNCIEVHTFIHIVPINYNGNMNFDLQSRLHILM